MSAKKLEAVLTAYQDYHAMYEIDEIKNVYMDENELRELNS